MTAIDVGYVFLTVRKTLTGIARKHGRPKSGKALPVNDLERIVAPDPFPPSKKDWLPEEQAAKCSLERLHTQSLQLEQQPDRVQYQTDEAADNRSVNPDVLQVPSDLQLELA